MAHLWWLECKCHCERIAKGLHKILLYLSKLNNRAKTFTTARRSVGTPETKKAAHQPLVDPCNVLLAPLHIKLGPMQCFVKALDRNGPQFSSLCAKFPRCSKENIKAGVFSWPHIRKLFKKPQFVLAVSDDENVDWNAFRHVTADLLANAKPSTSGNCWSYYFLREARLQHVTQDSIPPLKLGFLSG